MSHFEDKNMNLCEFSFEEIWECEACDNLCKIYISTTINSENTNFTGSDKMGCLFGRNDIVSWQLTKLESLKND